MGKTVKKCIVGELFQEFFMFLMNRERERERERDPRVTLAAYGFSQGQTGKFVYCADNFIFRNSYCVSEVTSRTFLCGSGSEIFRIVINSPK